MSTLDHVGMANAADQGDQYAQMAFVVAQLMAKNATATLVEVLSVSQTGEADSPAGFVDCRPLVQQATGAGRAVDHVTMNNVPFFRLQGADGAVVADPGTGDIGLAVFASRDISKVKNTRKAGLPGSKRMFDWGDGLYLGGFRQDAPTQFLRFLASGVSLVAPLASVTGNFTVSTGADGSFSTPAGQLVTVRGGIITGIE